MLLPPRIHREAARNNFWQCIYEILPQMNASRSCSACGEDRRVWILGSEERPDDENLRWDSRLAWWIRMFTTSMTKERKDVYSSLNKYYIKRICIKTDGCMLSSLQRYHFFFNFSFISVSIFFVLFTLISHCFSMRSTSLRSSLTSNRKSRLLSDRASNSLTHAAMQECLSVDEAIRESRPVRSCRQVKEDTWAYNDSISYFSLSSVRGAVTWDGVFFSPSNT